MKLQRHHYLVLSLAWMGLIFYLSSIPDLRSSLPGSWDLILRKFAHAGEYAVLYFLVRKTIASGRAETAGERIWPDLMVLAISLMYAVSDEWHQSLVVGRSSSVVDVMIDAIGIVLSAAYIRISRNHRLRDKMNLN